jgi:hypothetical protein
MASNKTDQTACPCKKEIKTEKYKLGGLKSMKIFSQNVWDNFPKSIVIHTQNPQMVGTAHHRTPPTITHP